VPWSGTTLRKLLGTLRAGMGAQRHGAQVDHVVNWLRQARAAQGRWQPTRSGGRDGVNVPRRQGAWQEGATAPVAVLDRHGKRVGTRSLGQMPESGPNTLSEPLTAVMQDVLRRVDRPTLRLVDGSDDGYHPSDSSHNVLTKMTDPHRPWGQLLGGRIGDASHACLSLTQLAAALCGPGTQRQGWANERRKPWQTPSDGVTRVFLSAAALRRQHGLLGKATSSDQAATSLKKRRQWVRYKHESSQRRPIGSGITEAACTVVLTQRLKRSGLSWTREGGQVILDLRVIGGSGVWDDVHQRSLAAQLRPVIQVDMAKDVQLGQQAA
jgi:hypothetical protein